ncbi:MAG: hypothetical protein HF982_07660 [Desulfobacteraceae bacterium]|nr:hypothetical protein [Desulfobacteraceae bacterium]MBC2719447.1 hypothetical protein [Desulfobacteraceae bacterium]
MKKYQNQKLSVSKNQRGATAIIVGASMFALVGLAALVVDLGNIYVARNELQNAADAGALAGAIMLYNDTGTAINCFDINGDDSKSANKVAYNVATANYSQKNDDGQTVPVEVNWTPGDDTTDNINNNIAAVQRGHWSFANKEFTANPSFAITDLWNVTAAELDADPDFINAVRVVARRQATPVASFFARIFGYEGFEVSAEAVGYIGFSGKLAPGDVDQPIAICKDSILNNDDEYDCTIGRMINSGQDAESNETGGWTSFNQEDNPCAGGTNANDLKDLVCASGNPEEISLGEPMEMTGGQDSVIFKALKDCWEDETGTTQPWTLTLPVIDCGDANNVGTCAEVVGAVALNIIWITGEGEDPLYNDAPEVMTNVPSVDDWSISTHEGVLLTDLEGGYVVDDTYAEGTFVGDVFATDGKVRWASFVQYFNLLNDDGTPDGTPAPYVKKSIYFLPDCTPHLPTGTSGGENFGKLAKIPVLVH